MKYLLAHMYRFALIPALLALTFVPLSSIPANAAKAPAKTTVSLTFDDALASQTTAQTLLDQHKMKGTFYLISGDLGISGHLTVAQAQAMQADGQDIGGHTITHPDLPTLSESQQQHEICDGRSALAGFGLNAATFAYPFGDYNSTSEQVVKSCGFSGARAVGGIDCSSSCDKAETIPPSDPYAIQTPGSIQSNTSLSTMKSYVTNAEKGGGWVVLVMHDVCTAGTNGCDPTYSVSKSELNNFLTWLQTQNVSVKTMEQVMGPGTTSAPPPPPPTTIQNASLEADTTGANVPDCWQEGGYGTNAPSWSRSGDAYSGSWAETMQLTSYTDGDAKLVTQQHDPSCEPIGMVGNSYDVSVWYKSNQPIYLDAYYLDSTGAWQFWDSSNAFAASDTYQQADWTTPAFPAGATRISIGVSLRAVGSVTMDDFGLSQHTTQAPPAILQNASLEADTTGANVPDCWQEGGFGTNAPTWTRTSDAHSGSWAETMQLTSISSGDAKLVSQQHDANCEPVGAVGHTYNVSTWYKSNQPVYLVAYYLDSTGTWQFWDESNELPASTNYTQASWTTPTFPSGATRISVGVSLRSVGSVTMDDFGLTEN